MTAIRAAQDLIVAADLLAAIGQRSPSCVQIVTCTKLHGRSELSALLQGTAPFGIRFSCYLSCLQAVTRNELYGFLHPSTREWKEGLMSVIYRDMSNNKTNKHQWIVLDGDIDAEWIESMNTVMDDNKMLTLASNERIPLSASMRLLLEINHMNHCSPATVSRGGVIYVNADDVGWKPVSSWGVKLAYAGTSGAAAA